MTGSPLLATAYTGPPPLTLTSALTSWVLDPGGLVLVAALAVPYVLGLRRLRGAGPEDGSGPRWPTGRLVAYASGVVVVAVVVFSFLQVYSRTLFWVTSVQMALLLTVAPVLLALGAPVTLARRAAPAAGRRLDRLLGAAPVRLITFPLVAAAVVAVTPFLVYFTPVFEASLRHGVVQWLVHAALLAVGLAFFWPVLAVDREPVLPFAALALVVFLETLVDSIPGIVLWLSTRVLALGYYLEVARPWGRSLLADQRFGGVMLWAIGELVGLPLLLLVAVRWVRADAAEAARVDAELDRLERESGTG